MSDTLGYYGFSSAVIGAGITGFTYWTENLAKEGIKNTQIAGAEVEGNIFKKLAASLAAEKTAARITDLRRTLGFASKISGVIGASSTAVSIGLRSYCINDCIDECSDCPK